VSGLVGGVAGCRRLQAHLVEQNRRVVVIDPYLLSIDSAEVNFTALARRVDRVLDSLQVTGVKLVGHAHGGGVALRLAANAPHRVSALYLLDVGALPDHRSRVFGKSLRLVPLITRMPGGRGFIQRRFVSGLRENAGRQDWLDEATRRAYTEPLLDEIDRVVALARRLARAKEPDSMPALIDRVRVPVTVVLGDVPHASGPGPGELSVLEPLGSRLRVEHLPAVGHFPHEEAPAELTTILLAARPQIVASAPDVAR
jgi:pimeloyl-ACP methyl ester carboxylesterase